MSQRYQREIEEILGSFESPLSDSSISRKRRFLRSMSGLALKLVGGRGWRLSPGRIILASLVLLLVALLIRGNTPGVVAPIAWAGVVLFILGYALFFINPPHYEKRWRGHVVEARPRWRARWVRWFRGQ